MTRTRALVVSTLLLVAAFAPFGPVGTAAAANCPFPVSSTDATGTNVTVDAEPERVVTLNPSAAQTVWEIGAEEKVVGLSGFASYLDGADERKNVYPTTGTGVNVEAVINLTPDLVLAPNTIPNDTVSQLRGAGLTVYKFGWATDVAFVVEKTRRTGRLVGACDGADDRADRLESEVATIREATQGVDRPRVFYDFFGFTAGTGTFIHTIITTAGGENVAAEVGISGYASYSEEVVVANDPEWILLNTDDPTVPDTEAFAGTAAEEEGQNVTVDANYVSQPAPRIVQPMLTIVKALHPGEYRRAKRGVETVREEAVERQPPAFTITAAVANRSRVELNDVATVLVNVTNDGGPGEFEAGLYLNGSLKDVESVHLDGSESATIRFHHTFGSWGNQVLRVNDRRVGTVSVVKELGQPANESTETSTNSTPTVTGTSTPVPTPSPTSAVPTTAPAGSPSTPPAQATPPPFGRTETTDAGRTGRSTTRSSGQSGFGVSLAALALLGAVLLASRRQ